MVWHNRQTAGWLTEVHAPFATIDAVMNRGEEVIAELPDCNNDLDGYRYLQGKITAASDEKAFRTLYDNLAPEVRGAPTKHAAAQLLSVSGPWTGTRNARTHPTSSSQALCSARSSAWSCSCLIPGCYSPTDLQQPVLPVPGTTHVKEAHGHHAVCCKHNNEYGSRTRWHDEIRDQVIGIARGGGPHRDREVQRPTRTRRARGASSAPSTFVALSTVNRPTDRPPTAGEGNKSRH
jgi:hypothetical protein